MLEAVILAGGRGERFWPLSRRARPKQLLRLFGETSLLRAAWDRMRHRLPPEAIRVVAGADLERAVREDLPELSENGFVREPVGRNTGPACAVAAALALREGHDPLQLVVPADHWIPETARFWECVDEAIAVASAPDAPLVTFGVPITRAETGYGYLERGAPRPESPRAHQVARFHEKPDPAAALGYAGNATFYWNSGIFLWRASALLEEVERHLPELAAALARLRGPASPHTHLGEVFVAAPAISIDHGVLERSTRVALVEACFAWNDLGNWSSWADQTGGDADGNACRGASVSVDAHGCVLYADSGLVAVLGVRDLIVVRAGDVTLVADRNRAQEVRRLLDALRGQPRLEGYL
jgi:mannose-1-phosphate guanylyltransferase/mannose-6-phosphate isomerase